MDHCTKYLTSELCCASKVYPIHNVPPDVNSFPLTLVQSNCTWCPNILGQSFCYSSDNVVLNQYCRDFSWTASLLDRYTSTDLSSLCDSVWIYSASKRRFLSCLYSLFAALTFTIPIILMIKGVSKRSNSFVLTKSRLVKRMTLLTQQNDLRIKTDVEKVKEAVRNKTGVNTLSMTVNGVASNKDIDPDTIENVEGLRSQIESHTNALNAVLERLNEQDDPNDMVGSCTKVKALRENELKLRGTIAVMKTRIELLEGVIRQSEASERLREGY